VWAAHRRRPIGARWLSLGAGCGGVQAAAVLATAIGWAVRGSPDLESVLAGLVGGGVVAIVPASAGLACWLTFKHRQDYERLVDAFD
jgi:hypothetical protein